MTQQIKMGIYRHYKGPLYQVFGLAHDANDDKRLVVVYIPLQLDIAHLGPRLSVRTLENFTGQVHADGTTCTAPSTCIFGPDVHLPRFEYLGPVLERWMMEDR